LKVLGWVALASMLAVAILGPAAGGASAVPSGTLLHQTPPISWNAAGFEDEDCGAVGAGQVLWHFVLVQTTATTPSRMVAFFQNAGRVEVYSYKNSGGVLHFNVTTGQDTLLSASTVAVGRWLNLSHICVGPPLTTTTTTTTTTTRTTTNNTTI
jgi:hypothetical protein